MQVQFVTRDEYISDKQTDHDDMLAEIMASVSTSQKVLARNISDIFTANINSSADRLNKRMDEYWNRLEALEGQYTDVQELRDSLMQQAAKVKDLEELVRKAVIRQDINETATPLISMQSDEFDREIDHTFLWIESAELIDIEAATAATQEWIAKLNIDASMYKITGKSGLIKKFKLKFLGIPGVAAQNAGRALRHLKEDGEWVQMYADTPNNTRCRVYINLDKNPKQRKTEIACRDLARIISKDTNLSCFPNKRTSTVNYNYVPICEIECTSIDAPPIIRWNNQHIGTLPSKLDKTSIKELFSKAKAESNEKYHFSV